MVAVSLKKKNYIIFSIINKISYINVCFFIVFSLAFLFFAHLLLSTFRGREKKKKKKRGGGGGGGGGRVLFRFVCT
eukprot:COSAG06_NODE_58467_length_277_cov_0.573034_1_plen_75_part_01